jgi:hypothetical protein
LAVFGAAVPSSIGAGERAELVTRFSFSDLGWVEESREEQAATSRAVNPSLSHIQAWISSVGAAVALGDLDGDGLANDACAVDPRTDAVTVTGVPGDNARFDALELNPAGLRYDSTMAPMGCVIGDLDENGTTDALVYYWGRSPVMFLRRTDTPLSPDAFVVEELVPAVPRWFTNAVLLADLDGDGHQDVVVANYFADGARILDHRQRSDEQMQDSMSRAFNGGGTYFLLGSLTATGVTFRQAESGLAHDELHGWTLAAGAFDLDDDLLPEIYLANDFGPDRLLSNRSSPGKLELVSVSGHRRFTTPASRVLGHDSFKGMGVDFGDIDADGNTDIFVSNITQTYGLLESNFAFLGADDPTSLRRGDAPFDDHSESLGLARSGWCWDAKIADFDNDGGAEIVQAAGFVEGRTNRWPELQELAMANDELLHDPAFWPEFGAGDDLSGRQGVRFFVRASDRFAELSRDVGLGRQTVSRGIAIADVDGDGDLDIAVANQWDRFSLYRNNCPLCGTSLGLRVRRSLAGGGGIVVIDSSQVPTAEVTDTTTAVGAAAVVVLPDGRRAQISVDGGNGHSGRRSDELHVGLGDLTEPLRVELTWRDVNGEVQRSVARIAPGRHTIILGDH